MTYTDIIARCNPSMNRDEVEQLLTLLEEIRVDVVLEIGTHVGGSARLWRDVLRPEEVITVDSGYPEFVGGDRAITRIVGVKSQEPECRESVEAALAGRLVDFLFIDGGHTFEEVSVDYATYSEFVRPGGVIAFHDVNTPDAPGVAQLWASLDGWLLWADSPGATGIGVVRR